MLVLPQELTLAQATACQRMLSQALRAEQGSAVVVDAGALQRFDSSALAVLLDCRRDARAQGKSLSIAAMPGRLADLARLYGVAELLPAN